MSSSTAPNAHIAAMRERRAMARLRADALPRILARVGSATERRRWRSEVRHRLGTTRDDAPTAETALRAAGALNVLLGEASGGELGIAIVNRAGEEVDLGTAMRYARADRLGEPRTAPEV